MYPLSVSIQVVQHFCCTVNLFLHCLWQSNCYLMFNSGRFRKITGDVRTVLLHSPEATEALCCWLHEPVEGEQGRWLMQPPGAKQTAASRYLQQRVQAQGIYLLVPSLRNDNLSPIWLMMKLFSCEFWHYYVGNHKDGVKVWQVINENYGANFIDTVTIMCILLYLFFCFITGKEHCWPEWTSHDLCFSQQTPSVQHQMQPEVHRDQPGAI